ncbi:21 kDa protein-like [Solanum tuberosum]|uniref:Pectinesterase inhibitor domain-containing protein n=2 Tax=Solanum tuberosum TaxID=4113 RepID=M0ZT42_SOLTU|nr:PREDICTED: 21 kDa protein-like [Solanum tuberosum]
MKMFRFLLLLVLLLILHFSHFTNGKKTITSYSTNHLVYTSCTKASYPKICIRTLSSYSTIKTPKDLAKASLNVSISRANKASKFLKNLKVKSKREKGALVDCIEQIGDSIHELRKALFELKHLHKGIGFKFQMNNLETWISASLTNDDTCLDGFKEIDGKVRYDVKRKISNVAKVTSNALYLINLLYNRGGSRI